MTFRTTHKRAVIFHGYGATPADHWFGWLAERLQAKGIRATIPVLPSPLDPQPEQWEDRVRTAVGELDEHTILVAHSLGCLSVLRCLTSMEDTWRLGALVLVSGFTERLPALPELDAFIGEGCDVTGLSEHIGRIAVIRSDDDPIVPPAHTDRLAARLGTSVRVQPGAGHFLAADGITELPVVFDSMGA